MATPRAPIQPSNAGSSPGDNVYRMQQVDATGSSIIGGTGGGKGLAFLKIDVSASGATQLVALVAAKRIKVVSYVVVAASAVNVSFLSAATGITGAMPFAANGGVAMCGQPEGHLFQTAPGEALSINLSGAVQVSGHISYFVEA